MLNRRHFPSQANVLSTIHLIEGKSYTDLGLYALAIEVLSKAIVENPKNREALLERAVAYFETGAWDRCVKDFLSAEYRSTPIDASHIDFARGFLSGSIDGIKEAVADFIPGLLSSAKGLGSGLWALAIDPIQFSEEAYEACRSFIQFISSQTIAENIESISPKLKALIYDLDSLTLQERGEHLGYLISKNGLELFAATGAIKAYQEMRQANAILTLETLAATPQKGKVLEKAIEWGERHTAEIQKIRANEAYIKTFRGQNFSETTIRKTLHELGYKTFPRPKGLPDHFKTEFSGKNGGMIYCDPQNKHTYVRVMPGDPKCSNTWQQKPYVQRVHEGNFLDKHGNQFNAEGEKYIRGLEETHIPLEEFEFIVKKKKPKSIAYK